MVQSALEGGDGEDLEDREDLDDFGPELSPFVPTSPGELLLALALAVPSLLFLVYLSVVCYRLVCCFSLVTLLLQVCVHEELCRVALGQSGHTAGLLYTDCSGGS